jgi:hypothetical protein
MYNPKSGKVSKLRALWGIACRRAAQGHVSVPRQLAEIVALGLRNRLRPQLYYAAGLYRRELDWRTKCTFIGDAVYYRSIREIAPPHLRILTNHKVVSRAYLATFGIPTVRFFGVIDRDHGVTFDNQPLRTHDDLSALLRRIDARSVCFKLISGLRGEGFLKVVVDAGADPLAVMIEPDGRRVTVESLWSDSLQVKRHGGYYCEATIIQHPDAARFYPHSVNTIRSWSYRRSDGRWEIHGAVMRMGVGGKAMDNLSQGGIGPRVDLSTGRLRTAIELSPNRTLHEVHPTTGVRLDGAEVPEWDRVVELIHSTCEVFPMFDLLAVDVALSVDGPIVTEIESTPDTHQVGFDRGLGPMIHELLQHRRAAAPTT